MRQWRITSCAGERAAILSHPTIRPMRKSWSTAQARPRTDFKRRWDRRRSRSRSSAFLARIEERPEAQSPQQPLAALDEVQAVYAEKNIGHYGLGAEGYLHFTSPIRRYPDLMVHRLLSLEWLGKPAVEADDLAAVARRCSERERAAMSAEREIDNFYGALWAADHVGERFAGTIDGATDAGLFVEIDAHMVSGLVAAEGLGRAARLDKPAQRWILGRTGATLGIGDTIEIEIASANVARRQIDLALIAVPQDRLPRSNDGRSHRHRERRGRLRGPGCGTMAKRTVPERRSTQSRPGQEEVRPEPKAEGRTTLNRRTAPGKWRHGFGSGAHHRPICGRASWPAAPSWSRCAPRRSSSGSCPGAPCG